MRNWNTIATDIRKKLKQKKYEESHKNYNLEESM